MQTADTEEESELSASIQGAATTLDIWKEEVQMEAIQLPRHVHHTWLTDRSWNL